MVGGAICAWAIIAFAYHAKTLAVNPRVIPQLYDFSQYPGIGAARWFGAMAGNLWHLVAAGLFASAAVGYGLRALELLRIDYPSPALRPLLASAAGFALLGVAVLGFGLAGLWYWWLPVALMGGGFAALWPHRASLRSFVPPRAGSGWGLAAKALTFLVAGFVVVVALAPEEFYDSLVYHVADPSNWIKAHKVFFLKYNFFSNFPFTFEMLYGAGLMLGSDTIARLTHTAITLSASALCGWLAWWVARRHDPVASAPVSPSTGFRASPLQGNGSGWLGALICLSTPIIGNSGWMTGIDGGLVLYEVAAVVAFVMWWTARRDSVARLRGEPHWLLLCGVLCGLGMGVKYTLGMTVGLLGLGIFLRVASPGGSAALRILAYATVAFLVPFTLANIKEVQDMGWKSWGGAFTAVWEIACLAAGVRIAARWGWRNVGRGIWRACAFGVVASVFVSPWNLKSLLFTASPAYPFAFHLLGGFHISPPRMDYQMGEFREYVFRPLAQFLTIPWNVTGISGYSNNSSLGGLFLAMIPLLFAFRKVDVTVRLLGVILLGRFLLWCNVSNIVRYFAPGLALMGVLVAVGVDRYCAPRKWIRAAGYAAVFAFTLLNIYVTVMVAQGSVSFLGVVAGLERQRDYYLRERSSYPCAPYLACEAMNRDLPKGSRVLFLGEARGYFYRGPVVAATVFDFPPLIDMCREAKTPAEMDKKMRQLGAKYIFLAEAEAQRTAGYRLFDWETPRQRALFEKWWMGNMSLLWKAGMMEVLELVPGGVRERTASLKLVQVPFDEYDELQKILGRMDRATSAANYSEAEAAAREALAKAPQVPAIWEGLAQVLAVAGQDRKAVESYRKALALGLVSTSAHHNLAILYQRMGRPEDSAREYQRANEITTKWKTGPE